VAALSALGKLRGARFQSTRGIVPSFDCRVGWATTRTETGGTFRHTFQSRFSLTGPDSRLQWQPTSGSWLAPDSNSTRFRGLSEDAKDVRDRGKRADRKEGLHNDA
jgi:hypothetical protein